MMHQVFPDNYDKSLRSETCGGDAQANRVHICTAPQSSP